ncbi:hypothetical protein DFP93_102102 [Aneurinibacillus soli]|uniref:Uncharacterized protein n=1 Tax=Aneurinibacillus soli TaxID=1500254 RepID=A0A0U5AZD3_9BACL|nr:hypothetical protein [Aneurinibacillus soli]PYE63418.1 hypothetical protein DFP93_102102 [Aneurinibacillus soli]BAU27650.1 hypothetical protein CB4_01824 [Aneurinibacillus soli]
MEYRLKVDEHGRVPIPEEIREQLGYGALTFQAIENLIVISKNKPEKEFIWTPQK